MHHAARTYLAWATLALSLAGCNRGPLVEGAPSLPLRRVVIYRNGVAYFERQGHVYGNEVRFRVQQSEVGDFLSTLSVMERGGSSIRSAAFPMPPDILGDAALRPTARRTVRLTLDGSGHDLTVGYTVETPIWRPSYRLVADAAGRLQVQAWGIVQNLSGEDWTDVRLSLVAGSPVSFRSELANAVIPTRPVVTDRGAVIDAVPLAQTTLAQQPPADSTPTSPSTVSTRGAFAALTGTEVGDAPGLGGLGVGGGGSGEGTLGLGDLGTMGHGSGSGQGYGSGAGSGLRGRGTAGPTVRAAPPSITGLLSPEVVRRVVLRNIGQVNHCYEQGLYFDPNLAGRVTVRFVIGGTGTVMASSIADSSVAQPSVGECVATAVRRWQFPAPEGGGLVTVSYPFNMQPADDGGAPSTRRAAGPAPAPPPPSSAPRSTSRLALVTAEGGATRYDLPARVTVPDHSATMVMLVSREVPGSLTYLFAPDPGVADSTRHPFHVVRFENRTGAMLERGPLAIFQSNSFLGEGLLEPLPDRASATVPFALVRAISVENRTADSTEGARLIRIHHDSITLERYHVARVTYHLRNGMDRAVEIRVRQPLSTGAAVFEPPAGTEPVDGAALVPFRVPARGQLDPVVVVRNPFTTTAEWTSDEAATAVTAYLRDGHPDATLAAALQSALDLRRQIEDFTRERDNLTQSRDTHAQAQDEIRQNLESLRGNAGAGDLRARLVARLARLAAEDDANTRRLVTLDTDLGERRVRLAETVRGIDLDTTAATSH